MNTEKSSKFFRRILIAAVLILCLLIGGVILFQSLYGNTAVTDPADGAGEKIATFGIVSTAGQINPEKISSINQSAQNSNATPTEAKASYHFTRFGKDGEVISIAALTDEKLAEGILMDVLSKSAAWQGVDVGTLEEYYLIEQTFADTGESFVYYAYLLADGRAVLQSGTNGMYSSLSQELYDRLDGIYKNAVERTGD